MHMYLLIVQLLQAIENFAWNVRTLKGQAELIRASKDKCVEYLSQVSNQPCLYFIEFLYIS